VVSGVVAADMEVDVEGDRGAETPGGGPTACGPCEEHTLWSPALTATAGCGCIRQKYGMHGRLAGELIGDDDSPRTVPVLITHLVTLVFR